MARLLPYGLTDFARIRKDDYYVDKTQLRKYAADERVQQSIGHTQLRLLGTVSRMGASGVERVLAKFTSHRDREYHFFILPIGRVDMGVEKIPNFPNVPHFLSNAFFCDMRL